MVESQMSSYLRCDLDADDPLSVNVCYACLCSNTSVRVCMKCVFDREGGQKEGEGEMEGASGSESEEETVWMALFCCSRCVCFLCINKLITIIVRQQPCLYACCQRLSCTSESVFRQQRLTRITHYTTCRFMTFNTSVEEIKIRKTRQGS